MVAIIQLQELFESATRLQDPKEIQKRGNRGEDKKTAILVL